MFDRPISKGFQNRILHLCKQGTVEMTHINWVRRKNEWASGKYIMRKFFDWRETVIQKAARMEGADVLQAENWLCIKFLSKKQEVGFCEYVSMWWNHISPPFLSPIHTTITMFRTKEFIFLWTSVTRRIYFYPRTGFYFRMCEDGADWHLIPCRISPHSEFFPRAHKNWHIMWGINLGLDWPPLARGSKISHNPHTHQVAFLPPLDNGRYGPLGWDVIILYCSSRQLWFPVWYFKGIYRTILSKIT